MDQAWGASGSREPDGIGATLREGGTALALITLVALVARGINLGSGYWADEIFALQQSFRLPGAGVFLTFLGDNHHPLYSIFGRLSLVVFGESPWSLRLPAVVFGVLTVPGTYLVARIVASRGEALFASALIAVSYHHVWFSQNARGYTLVSLLALLSTWFLVRLLSDGSWKHAGAFALCAALAAYTHLTMIFVAFGQALAAAVIIARPPVGKPRVDWRVCAGAFVLSAILTLVFYAPVLTQVFDFFLNTPSDLQSKSTPMWALREGIRVLLVGLGGPVAAMAGIVVAIGGLVGLLGLASILTRSRALALAILFPPLTVAAGALLGRGTMYPRFFFFAAGLAVIVVVRGIFATGELVRRRWPAVPAMPAAVTVCALVVAASVASLRFNYRYPKQDFVGAMHYVLQSKSPDDAVGFVGIPGDPYPSVFGQNWPTVDTVDEVNALRAQGRMWLIYTFPRYLDVSAPKLAALVASDCHERAVFRGTVGGGDMIICTFDPA